MLILMLLLCAYGSPAQTSEKLNVGDLAPAISYSKWLKGKQFKTFDPNQIYVMEFWATWCSPCKAAMPHLTVLQKQYEDRITFVGVNVWEKIAKDQSYETVVPAVEKFVKGNDSNMGYTVFIDDKDQNMGNKWLRAAGQNGIPASFLVKNSHIIWVGHPNQLDSIIPKVLDGSYDMKVFKEKSDRSAQKAREENEAMMAIFNPIKDALAAKDHKKAFELMDKLAAERPDFKPSMSVLKFKTLLTDVDEKQAIAFATEFQREYKTAPSLFLGEVYKTDNLSKDTYAWVADNFGSTTEVSNPLILDALATCYAKAGQYAKAVDNQAKALAIAEKALKDGEMVGTVMDYTVEEYKKKLAEYKNKM